MFFAFEAAGRNPCVEKAKQRRALVQQNKELRGAGHRQAGSQNGGDQAVSGASCICRAAFFAGACNLPALQQFFGKGLHDAVLRILRFVSAVLHSPTC